MRAHTHTHTHSLPCQPYYPLQGMQTNSDLQATISLFVLPRFPQRASLPVDGHLLSMAILCSKFSSSHVLHCCSLQRKRSWMHANARGSGSAVVSTVATSLGSHSSSRRLAHHHHQQQQQAQEQLHEGRTWAPSTNACV